MEFSSGPKKKSMKSCLHNLWFPRNKVKREHYINVKHEGWFIGTANILQLIFFISEPLIFLLSTTAWDNRKSKPRFTTETRIFPFLLLPLFLSTHFPRAAALHKTEGNKCYYFLSFSIFVECTWPRILYYHGVLPRTAQVLAFHRDVIFVPNHHEYFAVPAIC